MAKRRQTKKGGGAPIEPWLAWRLHRRHPKVLRIAAMTGADPDHVLASVCEWFRWVDSACDTERTGVTPEMVDAIAGFRGRRGAKTLAEAFADPQVRWVTIDGDGTIVVVDFDRWFGQSARRRLVEARRKWLDRNRGQDADAEADTDADTSADTLRTPVRTLCGRGSGRGVEQEIEIDIEREREVGEGEPVQSQPSLRDSPCPPDSGGAVGVRAGSGGAGLALVGGYPSVPAAAPMPWLEGAWRGDEPLDCEENDVAVEMALLALGVGDPVLTRLVLARRLTVPEIAAHWAQVLRDEGARVKLKVLVGRLLRKCGYETRRDADAAREASLSPQEREAIAVIREIRRRRERLVAAS